MRDQLTKKEFDLLQFLHQHQNQVLSRDQLLDEVWGKHICVDNRTVDNFISTLKRRLELVEGKPYFIRSVRGVGYSLVQGSSS